MICLAADMCEVHAKWASLCATGRFLACSSIVLKTASLSKLPVGYCPLTGLNGIALTAKHRLVMQVSARGCSGAPTRKLSTGTALRRWLESTENAVTCYTVLFGFELHHHRLGSLAKIMQFVRFRSRPVPCTRYGSYKSTACYCRLN